MKVAIGPSSFAAKDRTPLEMLQRAGVEILPNPYGRRLNQEETIALLQEADGLLAGLEPLNRTVLAAAKNLKALARVGIGMTNVDREAAADLGIKVSNTPEAPAAAVAEMTLCCMLALCRRLVAVNNATHAGRWTKDVSLSLSGLPVLLVGYGHTGREVGRLLRAFGAKILVCDPFVTQADLTDGETVVSLEDGLAAARVVSLHASGEDVILDEAAFARMQDGVILLNASRGALVDEKALLAALDAGRIGGVWFDAFWREPYDGELCRYEQTLLTPHVCTYTIQCRKDMETKAVTNLLRDLGLSA